MDNDSDRIPIEILQHAFYDHGNLSMCSKGIIHYEWSGRKTPGRPPLHPSNPCRCVRKTLKLRLALFSGLPQDSIQIQRFYYLPTRLTQIPTGTEMVTTVKLYSQPAMRRSGIRMCPTSE